MDRRFSQFFLIVLFIGCQPQQSNDQKMATDSERPNIILMVADDHGMNDLGCYGHQAISTPNLDVLAAEGVRFNRAYATAPSCTASRSVILTGLHNHLNALYGHEHSYHHFRAHDFLKSLPVYLEEIGGYETARIGKYHVGPEKVFRFGKILPSNGRNTVQMADESAKFIKNATRPFFLYFCTHDPHRGGDIVEDNPYQPNRFGNRDEGYEGVEDYTITADEVLVPWYLPDLPETRAELVQYYQSVNRVDQGAGRLFQHLKDLGKWDNTIILYISDNGIAFQGAKTNIYEPGINLPLLIKNVDSKNAALVTDALVNWVDLTPTILDMAGILDQARDTLVASFAEYSTNGRNLQTAISDFHGVSFKPVLAGEQETVREESFASHTFHEITMYYPIRSIISGDYKLIWNIAHRLPYPHASDLWESATWQGALKSEDQKYGLSNLNDYTHRSEFQLFDLKKDPYESVNLVNSPSYQEVLGVMKRKLRKFQVETNDPWSVKWAHE